jgi:hypothetical protein
MGLIKYVKSMALIEMKFIVYEVRDFDKNILEEVM